MKDLRVDALHLENDREGRVALERRLCARDRGRPRLIEQDQTTVLRGGASSLLEDLAVLVEGRTPRASHGAKDQRDDGQRGRGWAEGQ